MKDRKKIIIIIIAVLGILLLMCGIMLTNNNSKSNSQSKNNTNDNQQSDISGLESEITIKDFTYNIDNNTCEFSFILNNNTNVDIKNQIIKINFYDANKTLLNSFDLNVNELENHDSMGIQSSIELDGEVTTFEFEINDIKREIDLSK